VSVTYSIKHKVLPGPWGLQSGTDLCFLSPQPDTSLHCKIMDTGLVHCSVHLFMPQLLLVLIAPIHKGMARLSWPGWLVTCWHGLLICW